MASIKKVCQTCNKEFLVIDLEQKFLNDHGLPLPFECSACRQARRMKLRGGRRLFRAKCQQCNKDIVVSYDPTTVKSKILCDTCFKQYNETHDNLIKDTENPAQSAPNENSQL